MLPLLPLLCAPLLVLLLLALVCLLLCGLLMVAGTPRCQNRASSSKDLREPCMLATHNRKNSTLS
jgi:hypothetical protein